MIWSLKVSPILINIVSQRGVYAKNAAVKLREHLLV